MALPLKQSGSELIQASEGDYLHKIGCQFTREQYRIRFKCELSEFYPNTISLYEMGELVAVAGYRGATSGRLFLEQYLDQPIESCIQQWFMPPAERDEIVELGGFAALNRNAAFALMIPLAPMLHDLGFKFLVCTANKPIQKCLAKLGLNPAFISAANPANMDTSETSWGDYYAGRPRVLAGNIRAGIRALEAHNSDRIDRQS